MKLRHIILITVMAGMALLSPDFAAAQDASTIVYVDALWCRVHAADCPDLILKEQKQTMTLGEADQLGYRIGESGQSGRTDCCLHGYTRQYPLAVTADDALGVAEVRVDDILKYHVHGCHRFTPDRDDYRMTLAEVLATPGNYHCEHCIERGPGFAQMTQEEWDKLPSHAAWVPPLGWAPSPFPTSAYPEQSEIDILLSETLHGDIGIQERTFINPVATVDNFVIMRFFFPVHRWLDLYQAYRCTGDTAILEQLRGSARNYNTLSKNYLSAAQYKARDPEGMAYMYTMAASAKITLQLALKYPGQVTAGELAEAEDFLMTIISVLQPTCEDNSNLDPQMDIPQPLADDFRTRAFNRALNGIGTIGMTVAALEDLQTLNSTTAYQSTIDRYRLIIQQYIINWKNTGFEENYEGLDYFSYPYSATDSGYWDGDIKLFSADDQGHYSHSLQGCYLLFESVPELGVDDAFMTAIANTIYFNAYTTSGSPQTPSQEAIRPYSRYPYGYPSSRFFMLEAFKDGLIDAQCNTQSALAKESTLSEYGSRLTTFNALYLKELRQDSTLIHMGEESVAPPAPPTGLSGTGSNGQVSLDWDDNTESDMASGTYTVYRSTTSGSGYTEIANSLSSSAYVDSAVVNDTMYFYVVTATDTNGDVSETSSEAHAAPFVPNGTPPAAPTGLGAAATDGSVSLDWADNSETDFNSYNIYRSTTSGSYGTALATDIIASEYVDTDVVNGTTYYYVVTALDHSSNESGQSAEISAVPASYGPTITFGSNNDGYGGFASSAATGTEVWSLTADSVNYAFGLPSTDEGHTASLLKSYSLDRSDGTTYTFEGVVDLTDGYGDDNNRIGVVLFNTTPTQTDDGGGGLYLRLNTDGADLSIKNGLNGTTLAGTTASGSYSGDSWIGTRVKFSADLVFTNIAGTDKIDLSFTFTDQDNNTDTLSTQVDAAGYTGTYCGFLTKWRQRGVDPTQNTPPVFDYRTFMVSNHTAVVSDTTPPAAPTGLGATAGDDYVSLDWVDNAEGDLATYSVYRSTTSGSYGGALASGLFSSSYVDNSAVNGNTYYYVVTATDTNSNESAQSAEASATPVSANQPPSFNLDPIVEANAQQDTAYSGTIADDASDPDSDPMTFSKTGGPAWLGVASDGTLSGTPGAVDVGLNSFTVQVDAIGGSDTATLEITVVTETTPPAAPTGLAATAGDGSVSLNWGDNAEPDLNSYSVYRSTTSGSYGAALASGLTASDYVDSTAANGTTYYYVVTAADDNSNESAQSGEVSATPQGSGGGSETVIVFGSDNDGVGGFTQTAGSATEIWTTQADSVQYRSEDGGTLNSSFLKSFVLDTALGNHYTFEGVVEMTDGYADDNNRLGFYLFGDTSTVPDENEAGAIGVIFNTDDSSSAGPPGNNADDNLALRVGIDSTLLAGAVTRTQVITPYAQDLFGTEVTFEVDIQYIDVSGTDSIQVTATLTDHNGEVTTVGPHTVAAADYTGSWFGFVNRARARNYTGSGGTPEGRSLPWVMSYKSITLTDNTAPVNQPPAFTSDPIVEANATEDAAYSGSIADNASDPESDPLTFLKMDGPAWLSIASDGSLSGTPTSGNVGLNSFIVMVTEPPGGGGSDTATLEITVDALPNLPPAFTSDPIVEANATEDSAYSGTIADNAGDPETDPMTFSKDSGPAWLNVATNGTLSGTPSSGDVGLNSFTVLVDAAGGSDTATLEITVDALTPAERYTLWATLYPSLGSETNWFDDHEPDGVNNLWEYGLGGDPTLDDAADVLPVWSHGSDGGTNWLYYTYDRRDDAAARGLTYTVWSGTNLVEGLSNTNQAWSVSPATNGMEAATHRMLTDEAPAGFMKLEIELAE